MVRTYRDLYPQVTDFENLYQAYRRAAKGKRGQPEVAGFEYDLEHQLLVLQEQLLAQRYKPGPYCSFYIHDPKHRLISAAPFRDRVAHHALCNIIEPIFERTFIGDSYANRVGKGTHRALDRAQFFSRKYSDVLQCDIRQFFPSIDHAVLRHLLARKLDDELTLWLCSAILDGGAGILNGEYDPVYFPGDDLFALTRPRGLPIGNLTSQFWANVYLNELDQFIKRRLHCEGYLRYVDDFLLFSNDKKQLWKWKADIVLFLEKLRLTLHRRESTVYPVVNGIPFLGFIVFPTHRRLKRRNAVNFQRRLKEWTRSVKMGQMRKEALDRRVQGWVAHAAHGDTWGLRKAILSEVRL